MAVCDVSGVCCGVDCYQYWDCTRDIQDKGVKTTKMESLDIGFEWLAGSLNSNAIRKFKEYNIQTRYNLQQLQIRLYRRNKYSWHSIGYLVDDSDHVTIMFNPQEAD